jgi:dipeptidyl aminopeptidase/acylaminoacyl peptidase
VVTEISKFNQKMAYVSKIYKNELSTSQQQYKAIGLENCSNFNPQWSPDGQWIAFLSDSSGYHHLYIMNADGECIRELFSPFGNVQTFKWSPDGKKIAFVMTTPKIPLESKYGFFTYKQPDMVNRLWLIDLTKKDTKPIPCTSDAFCVKGSGEYGTENEEFDWSPDNQSIIFTYSPSMSRDDCYLDSSLAILDVQTLNIIPLINKTQHESMPKYSLDGKWFAYLASQPPGYAFNRSVMIQSVDGKITKQLAQTPNQGPFFAGPNLIGWTHDQSHLLFFEPQGTKFQFLLLPTDGGQAKKLAMPHSFVDKPTLSQDGKYLGYIAQSSQTPPEAFIANLENLKPMQISQVNRDLSRTFPIHTEVISWKSSDGLSIEGLLTYPIHYQKGKTYPLILMIHGGPMSFFEDTYVGFPSIYAVSTLAQEGFMVIRPNPRGSTGYGKEFRCMNYGDWGGKDAEDLLSGVEALINDGLADPKRLGVMGWSYGGYMTARLITLTSRFKAAIMGAGISNLVSFAGTSDLSRLASDYLGEYREKPTLYFTLSPINSIQKVETPCLILQGKADERVPPGQSLEFYRALKKLNKPVKMIVYPGMGHGCRDPQMLIDMMHENVNWFKDHLLIQTNQ